MRSRDARKPDPHRRPDRAHEAAFDAHRNGPWVAQFREEAAAIERTLTFTTGELLED